MPAPVTPRPELARDLGVSHASAVVVGTIIGSGIFLVPAEMMQSVGSAKLVYLAWLVGGVLSFFGALTYAELGAMKPQAGGEYVYVRDAYGSLAGFLYAWTWFVIAKPASIATVVTGLVRILGTFPILSFFSANIIQYPFPVTWGQLFAIAAALLISLLNYLGVKKAGEFQLVFTLLKVAMILGIVVVCFSGIGSAQGRGWSNFATTFSDVKLGPVAGFMAALVAALWAYDGWNDLNMVAGEVSRPERNIPIALIAGVATVGMLYVLVNAGVQFVLCQRDRGLAAPRVRRRCPGARTHGRQYCLSRHGTVDAGCVEWHHHERGSRPLRSGARRIFFSSAGRGAFSVSHTFGGHRSASSLGDFATAARRQFPATIFPGDFCRMALLYDRRQYDLCIPQPRTASESPLSHVGLSFRASDLRRGCGCSLVLHLQE